jgi:HAD superfamily hydrolase (TIGR01490 family)
MGALSNNHIGRKTLSLAIFDLDNTLLGGDSDYLWGRFLVDQGLVDGDYYERENQRYYEEYKAGTLDIYEFLRFSLKPLAEHDLATLQGWHQQFMAEMITPIMLPKAAELLQHHRDTGDYLLIITATNLFVTSPIAEALGVDHILATEPEQANGRYTGEVHGIPCFQQGKVTRLNEWLAQSGNNLSDSWFYSDSHNDLPLLEMVTHPVVVDADETLAAHAEARGWPHISLR